MAKSLVENLSEPFDPEKYDDTYRKELLELLRAKAKGKKLPEPQEEGEARGRRPDGGAPRVGRADEALAGRPLERRSRKTGTGKRKTTTRKSAARKAS